LVKYFWYTAKKLDYTTFFP